MNAAKLDSLPDDVRNDFLNIIYEIEADAWDYSVKYSEDEAAMTRRAGMEPIVISDAEWWRVQELHWEGTLERFKEVAPENWQTFRDIILNAGWYPPQRIPPVPE
jgi:hypothetical protein